MMHAEKSQALPSASWRTRNAGGVLPVQKLLGSSLKKIQFFSSSPKARKGQYPASCSQAGEVPSCLREGQLLCSIQVFRGLNMGHPYSRGQSVLLSPPIPVLISSTTFSQTKNRNNIWPNIWAPWGPVKSIRKITNYTKHIDTVHKLTFILKFLLYLC